MSLDKQAVIRAAFELVEEDGLDQLSMRKLADRLSVKAPALYWHFGSKAELLGFMALDIYTGSIKSAPPSAGWPEWLANFGRALRKSFVSRRDAGRLCATARPVNDPRMSPDAMAKPLVSRGVERERALALLTSVISLTLGWSSIEVNGPLHDYLSEFFDFEAGYEEALTAMVGGFSAAA